MRTSTIGGALFLTAVVVGVFAPWLAHTDPVMGANLMVAEEPPGREFWFGTDAQGRDIYSRVLYGARISLTVGIFAQLINTIIGTALGLSAGYWGGWWDDVVTGLTNLLLAIPSLIFALAIMAILGPGLTSLLIALGLTNWSFTCRLARASALSLRSQGYVQAAKVLGYGDIRIMLTQVLPEYARAADRDRNARHGRHDPRRGCAVVPWARHPPAVSELGQHAVGGAQRDHHRAVALGVSGSCDLLHRARPQFARRRAARHPRSAVAEPTSMTLLSVEDLRIDLVGSESRHAAVDKVSFAIARGETFGLVGESGCGKSITALAIMGLLQRPLAIGGGAITLDGRSVDNLDADEMRRLRGKRLAMIFQEPMTALNPLLPVGRQIAEMFILHEGSSWRDAERRAVEVLARVRVPAPERRARDYPHQLSGGMRQRVMIAIALACSPDLLIADEPTTALDVTVQSEIVDLMKDLCAANGTAILMISHDLGLVASICRSVGVMYAGRLVEMRASADVFKTPAHPYTRGLVASLPRLGSRAAIGRQRLKEISGVVPSIADFPTGCRFHPRCDRSTELCTTTEPAVTALAGNGFVRCHHHG